MRNDERKGLLFLTTTVKLVLGVLILMLAFGVMTKLVSILFSSPEEQAVLQNAETLAKIVRELLKDESGYAWDTDTFYIKKDYTLVGFDSGSGDFVKTKTGRRIYRPGRCKEKACLCLYSATVKSNKEEEKDEDLVKCWTFPGEVYFIGYSWYVSKPDSSRYAGAVRKELKEVVNEGVPPGVRIVPQHLLIYGDFKEGTWNLFLEKLKKNNKNYVLITSFRKDFAEREKYFVKCSDLSESECKDETVSAIITKEGKNYRCVMSEESRICHLEEVENCEEGKISNYCACGGEVRNAGYCFKEGSVEYYSTIDCSKVSRCEDYCKIDGEKSCSGEELSACTRGECKVKINQECKVQTEFKQGGFEYTYYSCKKK